MIHTLRSRAQCAIALISACVYTAPVGLHGEQRIRPLAPGTTRSRSRTLTLRLHSGSPGTSTGRARDRYTICGYDTHAGAGIATTSPGPNRVKHTLNSDCFEPFDTTMLSAFTGRPPERSDRRFASCEMAIVAEVSRWCRLGERPDPGVMGGRIARTGKGTQPDPPFVAFPS